MPTSKIEFDSWRSFWDFRLEITSSSRFMRSPASQRFLDTVAAECHERATSIPAGRNFYRAQVAHRDELDDESGETFPGPAARTRMLPLRDRAREGRVNPKGIPCLYMAADEHTAIAESRPWIGSLVSVGLFQTKRELRIVDCTDGADRHPFYLEGEPEPAKRSEAVWCYIARAFREPVTRDDDRAEYAATQSIADVFRTQKFDGLAYRSSFGTDRYNIALFDINAADLVMCRLYEIRDVQLRYTETANPYFVQNKPPSD